MASGMRRKRPFSARLDVAVLERLRDRSRRTGQSGARLAERLIDEGLRMEEFPGIVFRSGPAGRRAALVNGPDVWEIMRDVKRATAEGLDPIAAVARSASLRPEQVELAAAYYDAFPDEVDERIRSNEEMAERVRRTLEGPTAA